MIAGGNIGAEEQSMSRLSHRLIVSLVLVLSAAFAHSQNDKPGSKDYPGITRMPTYYIYGASEAKFDGFTFPVTVNGKETEQQVEGHLYKYQYVQKENAAPTSTLQVIRNYQNAVKAAGGQVMNDASGDSGSWRNTTLRFTKGDKEVWILIEARSDHHDLTIVEKQAMAQEVAISAEILGNDLNAGGRVAIYGIYFDTGKADVKPESGPALVEIAKLLKQKPTLKVFIVGHTDMVGDTAANMKLSQARAQSVASLLTLKYGIAAARLIPFGNGPYSPVASNKNDDGRAKNRRVELVEMATK
jgi:outer membrane protein OmpA-like peptidoglycan-associated protein